jgi:putative addiction module CopG family antidote
MIESLPTDLQHFIQAQVAAGNYQSEAAVVTRAVELLRDQQEDYRRLKAEVQRRIRSLEDGNYIEINGDDDLRTFFDGIMHEVEQKRSAERQDAQ